jgi:choline dehydrogenase-like flavoprotein
MQLDAQNIEDGTVLDADICIIGAGPAGISLAQEFVSHSAKVVLLESGGSNAEPWTQRLNDGLVVGTAYAGLQQTRHRQIGGTACIWNTPLNGDVGAKYVPLETCDLEPRTDSDYVGWPFELNHLQSFYARAQSVCGLGQYNYSGKQSHRLKTSFTLPDAKVRHSVFQFGSASIFTENHLRAINSSDNIELLFHATACAIKIQSQGHSMTTIEAGTLAGNRFRIMSGIVVLAAGAIENARLLLASREPGQDAPGDRYGWVGRCFMEHPRLLDVCDCE